jgi:hypothetical protein
MTVKPIETSYAGHCFRSRLEARWAVFFDSLRIPWHYELEGFELPSGWYLPDFWLPTINQDGVWFEVKPDNGEDDDPRWPEFAWEGIDFEGFPITTGRELIVAFGMPRPDRDLIYREGPGPECFMVSYCCGWDHCRAFCVCRCGATIGIQWDGIGSRNSCNCSLELGMPDYYGLYHPRIISAYTTARSARFEHRSSRHASSVSPF